MEDMGIKHGEVGCGLERPWEGGAAISLGNENPQKKLLGGGGKDGKKFHFLEGR
jgi:hypothetical protein